MVRAEGGRVTSGRRAVVEALLGSEQWVTAVDLVALVRPAWPAANESTVYRVLEVLERIGVVRHTHLGHGASYWHVAERFGQPLVCEACGAVVRVPDAWLRPIVDRVHAEFGFVITPHHFAWSGYCDACVDPTDPGAGS